MAIQYGGRMANERPDSNLNPDLSKQGLFQSDTETTTTEKASESTSQTSSVTSGQTSADTAENTVDTTTETEEDDDVFEDDTDYAEDEDYDDDDDYYYEDGEYYYDDDEEDEDDSTDTTGDDESSGGEKGNISTEDFIRANADLIKKVKNILDFVYPNSKVTLAELLAGAEGYISKYGIKRDEQSSDQQLTDIEITAFAEILSAFIEII